MEHKRGEHNDISKEINKRKKESKGADACEYEREKAKEIYKEIAIHEKAIEPINLELGKLLKSVGNIIHETVPISQDEKDNELVRTWGEIEEQKINGTPGAFHHHQLLRLIDGYDPERGTKIAGHRGYYLKGIGARLNMALWQYGVDFLDNREYELMQTPFFMKHGAMNATCQLGDFEEALYHVTTGNKEDEEMFLIATSEQPISAYYMKEWLNEADLPKRFCGFSTCFRKEAGAAGKDMWGIFRVHQFEKVEQFCITSPV